MSFKAISKQYEQNLVDVTKQVAEMATEKSNLLLDYVEKFINQMVASTNPPVKLAASRTMISRACGGKPIDVEDCVPYISYLDYKQHQLTGLSKALVLITSYFKMAERKCDNVLSKERCRKLLVGR